MAESPDQKPKAAPKRRKKSATNQVAVADKPIDPKIWLFLGVLLIVVAGFFYLDSASAGSVDTRSGGSGIQIIFDLVYSVLGRNLAFAVFGGLGGLSLIWGIIGWLKNKRSAPSATLESNKPD